jgi:hypothetical protein
MSVRHIRPKFTVKEATDLKSALGYMTQHFPDHKLTSIYDKLAAAIEAGPAKATGRPFQKRTGADGTGHYVDEKPEVSNG